MSNNGKIISYYGGKSEMAQRLIEWMPKHKIYLEPFAGGLSVFFKKKKAETNIVNDYDKDIANLYYVCSRIDLFEEFIERVQWLVQSSEIYNKIRDTIKSDKKHKIKIPNVQRAVDYFFFITTSFNNRPGTNLSKNTNKWDLEMIERLKYTRKKMDNVVIENLDINRFIKKYHKKQDALWFFDPPYYVANDTSYYGHVFSAYQHQNFKESIDLLANNPSARFMITYDDHEKIRELFSEYFIKEIPVKYRSTYDTIETNEILITNYKVYDKQQSLF